MSSYYIIRSRIDGKYLVARIKSSVSSQYLLLFTEDFLALTYLQQHSPNLANQFSIESISRSQLKVLLDRWNFTGVGVVNDPLIPDISFLTIDQV